MHHDKDDDVKSNTEGKVMQPMCAIFSSCDIRLSVDGINFGIRVVWRCVVCVCGVCATRAKNSIPRKSRRSNRGTCQSDWTPIYKATTHATSSILLYLFLFIHNIHIMVAEIALFDESLISPQVQAALPEGYTLRPLRANDYERGFLKVLEVLTEVGNQTKEEWMGKLLLYYK